MDGLDWMDGWLSYTAVTPRASLKSDANNTTIPSLEKNDHRLSLFWLLHLSELCAADKTASSYDSCY